MNNTLTIHTFLMPLLFTAALLTFANDTRADTADSDANDTLTTLNLAFVYYPPYYANTLKRNGPVMAIIAEAFEQEGISVNAEQMPWSRALKWSKQGKYHALCCAWFREERVEHFHFSDTLIANELVFFKLKQTDISYTNFTDLKPYQIGLVRDYAVPTAIIENNLSTQVTHNDKQNLKKLLAGRIDLALIDKAQGIYISQMNFPSESDQLEALQPAINTEAQYVVFPKVIEQSRHHLGSFNRGLKKLKLSGRYEEILIEHKIKKSSEPAQK